MSIGNDSHCPANIYVMYYTCNVKIENKIKIIEKT